MTTKILALSTLLVAAPVCAQHVSNPKASVLDVSARQTYLKQATEPLLRDAISHLGSCVSTPLVVPPQGPMQIPHHYMHGSNGPINPAEAEATRTYSAFEHRITSGMNQWVATGNQAEAACALQQLDAWAQAKALTDYDPKAWSQSWYQAEWSLASAGVTESVLKQDTALDAAKQERVTKWLQRAAHNLISYEELAKAGNNHHYWRALAATSIGVLAADDTLFRFGVQTFHEAVGQEDANGAFPLEMARHENAIHYQSFALQPLVMIAELAERQSVDLYGYSEHGRTIRGAIQFLGKAIADPSVVRQYTNDEQKMSFSPGDVAELNFYFARFGTDDVSDSLTNMLQHPAIAARIGGSTTVLAAK